MMSTVLNPQSFFHHSPAATPRLSPPRIVGRKRKADTDGDSLMNQGDRSRSPDDQDSDEHMNTSPSNSPNLDSRPLHRPIKRRRDTVTGRPLPLTRVLETVDPSTLKSILREICNRHPGLEPEILSLAPRPSVNSALSILSNYENGLRSAFPYGGNSEGDYAYYRVKAALVELLDALSDYTPHFLPPNENQAANSLQFLDGATDIIHRLPNWSTSIHNHHKLTSYEEISKAWVLVIKEAAKRGAGVGLQYGGWDAKISRHNEQSGGKMQAAVMEMKNSLPGASENSGKPRFGMPMYQPSVPVRSW